MVRLNAVLAFAALLVVSTHASQVSPVQKVIELLDDLRGKVETDTAAEEKAMTEYLEYCDMEAKDTQFAITTGEREMEDLGATIADCEARVAEYEEEISSISSTIADKEQELAEAADVRNEEHADYVAVEKDLLGTIDEMSRAQMTIKKEMATSLVQLRGQPSKKLQAIVKTLSKMVDAAWLDQGSKKRMTKFLQAQSGASADEAFSLKDQEKMMQPQAKTDAYESHSNGILDTVTDMEEKAQQSLSEARKKEMKGAHAYQMTKMSLQDAVKLLKSKLSEATQSKSSTTEEAGKAKGNRAGFAKSLQADKDYLVSLNTECASKSSEWEGRKESAKGEIEAISKAKEILASGVKAALVQTDKQMPLFESSRKAAKRAQLTQVLRDLAKKFHSYAMMEMASRAAADPFAKVKGLIEDMVTKLLNQANEEASHKAFCDDELSTSKKSQDDKMASMDNFQARMDSASTNRKELEEQIKVLQKEVADIDTAQKEAAAVREEEKTNFLKTVGDYKASAEAVAQAIQVLKNYYNGESSLIQKQQKTGVTAAKQPSFGEKKSDSAGSIISVLEVSEADFTKLVAEAETQENESVEAFRKLKEEDELAKTAKLAAVTGKTSEMKSLAVALDHYKEDHSAVSKELDAVMDYLDKLKPQCETKVMSYEERKARREAEIEGLKEALAIMDGTSVPVL